MSALSRGVRNAFRNVLRTGSIVVILSLSIGLIIAMLAARQAVNDKIASVKSSVGTTVTISPAGFGGGQGGGEALTSDQLSQVAKVTNVSSVLTTLSDRLTTSDSSLVSAIEPGSLGNRQSQNSGVDFQAPPQETNRSRSSSSSGSSSTVTRTFTMPVQVTGVSDATLTSVYGGSSLTWSSGQAFDARQDANVAVVGTTLATKNSLTVGSTFTAYSTTVTVVGIYDAGSTFANASAFMPLTTLQRLSSQTGAITSATATVNSSDNLATATTAIKTIFGDKADITNSQTVADNTVKPLQSVSSIALFSLIGAVVAGAVIILLTMVMIVRERRREIGVMKAIGSSNLGIVRQFIAEAVMLTAMALVVGLGIGIVASTPLTDALVTNSSSTTSTATTRGFGGPGMRGFGTTSSQTIKNIQASVGLQTLLLGLGAAFAIAVIGSAIPAFLISKVKPAEAMRNE